MAVTVKLRDGGRVRAERVRRDGKALHALVVEHAPRVDEARRISWLEPTGLAWKTWRARDVVDIEPDGRA